MWNWKKASNGLEESKRKFIELSRKVIKKKGKKTSILIYLLN
jgi:hypothetical protein